MNNTQDLLFELGVEELPARLIDPLIAGMEANMRSALVASALSCHSITAYATARRLALLVQGLPDKQQDSKVEKTGPWKQQAYSATGAPTKALLGFARATGVSPEALETITQDGKERLVARIYQRGRSTHELLPELLARLVMELKPQVSMRWGDGSRAFTRPVRWVTALFGDQPVACKLFGNQAVGHSYGHRFSAPGKVAIAAPAAYATSLEQARVIASRAERARRIQAGIAAVCDKLQCQSLATPDLLDELSGLVEYPRVMLGRFDPKFLRLPREVLITTLAAHQRYIALDSVAGTLAPNFIFVSNMPEDKDADDAAIVQGNERVLTPRLEDAEFFWHLDCEVGLAQYAKSLTEVVFETKLGTMADKSTRLMALCTTFAASCQDQNEAALMQAAQLCKADLASEMVGEFPELQGIIGGYLARHGGLPEPVSAAISEHYYPRNMGDILPGCREGKLLALADKLDHLTGLFLVGKQGNAQTDPFGARRACLGIIQLLLALGDAMSIGLRDLIALGLEQHKSVEPALRESLFNFFCERLINVYQRRNIEIQPVQAVLANGLDQLGEIDRRVHFLAAQQQQLEGLAQLIKRIRNLKKNSPADAVEVDTTMFNYDQERQLHASLVELAPQARASLATGDYAAYVDACQKLARPLAELFDGVMIKSGDAAMQRNRLALLHQVQLLCSELADVTRLQVSTTG